MKKFLSRYAFALSMAEFVCMSMPLLAATITNLDEAALRAALNGGGNINFACDGTLVLGDTLAISQNTVLDASGHNITLSGSNRVRVFYVNSNVTFTLKNLTVAEGRATGTNGASVQVTVWAGPFPTVYDYGTPGGAGMGGGLYNDGGRVTIFDCLFRSNSVYGGDGGRDTATNNAYGGAGCGGGIGNYRGTIVVSNSTFYANQAQGGAGGSGGAHEGGLAFGGALYSQLGSMEIYRSSFHSNSASGGRGSAFNGNYAAAGGISQGGAIANQGGELKVQDSSFLGNNAFGVNGTSLVIEWGISAYGGALLNQTGKVTIGNSTFENNNACGGNAGAAAHGGNGMGGALANFAGQLELVNCTVAGNKALGGGSSNTRAEGGNGQGGAAYTFGGSLCLTNITFASNMVAGGRGGIGGSYGYAQGGNLFVGNGLVTAQNTILAYSAVGGNAWGNIIDAGGNLSSDASCSFSSTNSFNNTDPQLGPLTDNGGPTKTMALLTGSPAINAGVNELAPIQDQRGVTRPQDGQVDIGAYEFGRTAFARRQSNGMIGLEYSVSPNQIRTLQYSSNLVHWSDLQSITAGENGMIRLEVPNDQPNRYFRTKMP